MHCLTCLEAVVIVHFPPVLVADWQTDIKVRISNADYLVI